jgi:hypothetical protein
VDGKEISIFIPGYEQCLMQPQGEIMIVRESEGVSKDDQYKLRCEDIRWRWSQ